MHLPENEKNDVRFKKQLPASWEMLAVDGLIKHRDDIKTGPFGSSLKKEIFVPEGYKVYGQENVIPDDFEAGNYYITEEVYQKMKKYEVNPGDILISLVGTHGKISLVPHGIHKGIINPRLLKIRFDTSKASPIYMKMLLESKMIENQINKLSHGLTMGIINTEIIKKLIFLIPPLKEQQKIASVITKVNELMQKIDQIIEQNRRLKNGLMQRLLTKGIGHKKFKKVKLQSSLISIPDEWKFKSLQEVSSITRLAGYEYTEYWKPTVNGSIIALRGFNIKENKLDINNVERISEELSNQLVRSKLNKGDVVFPCVGSIGKAALITEDRKYHINQNIAKITASKELNPLFLTYFLLSEITRHQISSYNASTSQPNVLVGNLRKFLIPLPTLSEQNMINKIITPLYSLLDTETNQKVNITKLKIGLMQQLLTGRIRVKI